MDTEHIYGMHGLGSLAENVVTDPSSTTGAIEIVCDELDGIDRAARRLRPDSEIASVPCVGGRPIGISPCVFEAVSVALRVAELSDDTQRTVARCPRPALQLVERPR